jgi:hypothetical protein
MPDIDHPTTVKVEFSKLKEPVPSSGEQKYPYGAQIVCANTSKRKFFGLRLIIKGLIGTNIKYDKDDNVISPGGDARTGQAPRNDDVICDITTIEIDNNKDLSININFGNAYLWDCEVHIQPINKIGAVIN